MSHMPPVMVVNPPGFRGFPEHDRDDPAYDVSAYGLDPEQFFVHFEAEHPIVVENATGFPVGVIKDGVFTADNSP